MEFPLTQTLDYGTHVSPHLPNRFDVFKDINELLIMPAMMGLLKPP